MKNLVIASTKKTPEIIFKASGELMITGSSLPANFAGFYQPILEWLEEFKESSPKKISISFELEHVNTSSTRIILQILRLLNGVNKGKNNLTVIWKYDHDDSDMLEQGEALQEILDRKFEFVIKD
jgi:hypothetical protein